jgi:DNA-binding Lrp family transcriptional regulator
MKEIGTPRSWQWNVRESYSSIAKRIGVNEETVRKRIKRQEKMGTIQGWRTMIHPSLLGLVDGYLDLEVGDVASKDRVISQLKLLEGVIVITSFEGPGLFIMFLSEPGEAFSRKSRLISSMCNSPKPEQGLSSFIPPCDVQFSPTDWRIIWSIKDDPRKNLSEIAKEAGVTTRTVNRRLTYVTEGRALTLMGLPNFRRTAGTTGNFLILCSNSDKKTSVEERILVRFPNIAFGSGNRNGLMFNIFFSNLSEAEEANKWIENLEGVQYVRMRIMKDMILVLDWLDEQIKKHLQNSN